MSNQTICCNRL